MADELRRRNLGRGLDALLGAARGGSSEAASSGTGALNLPIEQVYPGRAQPRTLFSQTEIDELADSIRALGILQPLIVRPHPTRSGCYEIIAGERRWRAAQQARLHEVPALVRELSDGEALEVALVENLQRENLSPVEEAEGYRRLMEEFSHTQEALGRIVGKSRSHVANMLRLLQLPDSVKEMLMDGRITAGHARTLLGASNPGALAETIVKRGLSVRQAERQARGGKGPRAGRTPRETTNEHKDSNTKSLENELSSILGLRVSIDFDDPGGRVTIAYGTLEQLDYLLHRLTLGEHGRPHPHPPSNRERAGTRASDPEVEAAWDEAEPFSFEDDEAEDTLDKLIADTNDDEPGANR